MELVSAKTSVLEATRQHVSAILEGQLLDGRAYHDLAHTLQVVAATQEIGRGMDLSVTEQEVVELSAWFHDLGHVERFEGHEAVGVKMAEAFLAQQGYPSEQIAQVRGCIEATKMPQAPRNLLEEIVCDADLYHLSQSDCGERARLLRQEWEAVSGKAFTDIEWLEVNRDFMVEHTYFTTYAQEHLEPSKQANLKKVKTTLKKLKKQQRKALAGELGVKPKKVKKVMDKIEKEENWPERGIQTMFRTTSRNHLDLSAMSDNKANIMISVNSIIISVILTVLIRKLDVNPHLALPTLLLLTVCLTAMVFAILATRPNVSSGRFTREDIQNKKANLLFFGNFHQMSLKDYEWGMQEMLRDSDYLYGSMINDIYFLGKVLGKKYRLLRISYTVFMFGLVLSVIAYIIAVVFFAPPGVSPLDSLKLDI